MPCGVKVNPDKINWGEKKGVKRKCDVCDTTRQNWAAAKEQDQVPQEQKTLTHNRQISADAKPHEGKTGSTELKHTVGAVTENEPQERTGDPSSNVVTAPVATEADKQESGLIRSSEVSAGHPGSGVVRHGDVNTGVEASDAPRHGEVIVTQQASGVINRGEIRFGHHGGRASKFIQAKENAEMTEMLTLLRDDWGLEEPNLLISVTGGAQYFGLGKSRLKEIFKRGLVKLALRSGAWIITGGSRAGVMKHIGEAINASGDKDKIVALGVATWGCVANRHTLGKFSQYESVHGPNNEIPLDPNHSHFILVDDGSEGKFGKEIEFRARLEKVVSETGLSRDKEQRPELNSAVKVPVVCVLVEGGEGSLKTVNDALKNKTPCVVIQGSGRVADVLALAFEGASDDEVRQKMKKIFSKKTEDHVTRMMGQIREIRQQKDLVSVFYMDSNDFAKDLDVAILYALLKARRGRDIDKLKLAIKWNRADIARIFINEATWEPALRNGQAENDSVWKLELEELHDAMLMALALDHMDFVKLFLENGLNLGSFLTQRRLQILYRMEPVLECSCKVPDPELVLFVWSLLLHHKELARIFWDEGKMSISTAIAAQMISDLMFEKSYDIEEKEAIMEQRNMFEEISVDLLKECEANDRKKTQQILTRGHEMFHGSTAMIQAVEAQNKRFIAQPACQAVLDNIWMGKISPENSMIRIWICILFPPLLFCLIKFKPTGSLQDKMTSTRKPVRNEKQHDKTSTPEAVHEDRVKQYQKLPYFFKAPMIVFIYNAIFYIAFLVLCTVILVNIQQNNVMIPEYVIIGWLVTLVVEEFRQVLWEDRAQFNLKQYVKNLWNALDILTVCLFTAGTVLRFIQNCDTCFNWGQSLLGVTLIAGYFRTVRILSFNKKLVMLGKIITNLLITLFSQNIGQMLDNTSEAWEFQRFSLVKQFDNRPPLPPPLILFNYLFMILSCCTCCTPQRTGFINRFDDDTENQLIEWENTRADEYLRQTEEAERTDTGVVVLDMSRRLAVLEEQVQGIAMSLDPSGKNQRRQRTSMNV